MNSFDEIQCEETSHAQLLFNMEEMAFMQEWMEARERDAQAELDVIADRHSDIYWNPYNRVWGEIWRLSATDLHDK